MTKPLDPYSRVYWRVAEDERFTTIFGDDHHFAAWVRLLMLADAMYPTVAPIPATARRASVRALADAGLIDLLPGGLYRVHGLKAERDRRGSRREPDGDRTGPRTEPDGTLARAGVAKPSQDETRQAETRTGRAPDPADVYWTLTGRYPTDKVLGWVDDLSASYGPEAVTRALATTHATDSSTNTLLGRTQDVLRADARALSLKEQASVRATLKERRSSAPVRDEAAIRAEIQRLMTPGAAA